MWTFSIVLAFWGIIYTIDSAAIDKRSDDDDVCDLDYFDKQQCGHREISESECLERGCCYEETHLADVPWCFTAYGTPEIVTSGPIGPEEFGLNPDELSEYDMAWVPDSGGSVPDHAVYVRDDGGNKYYIVRVEHEGIYYPGKLGSRHDNAHFAIRGEGELRSRTYEVLQQLPSSPLKLTWIEPVWGQEGPWLPMNVLMNYPVIGGEFPIDYGPPNLLIVVIGDTPEGKHPGYLGQRGRSAIIPWGGQALEVGDVTGPPSPGSHIGFMALVAIPEEELASITPPSPEYMQAALVDP